MIRAFRPEDAPACSHIVNACLERDDSLSEKLRSILQQAETPAMMLERSRLFYLVVSETDSVLQGFGGLEMNEIRVLYVAPEHHRKRIGSEILLHLLSLVPPALFSDVFVYSSPGAVSFYRAHGFRAQGEHFFDIQGEELPTVFMTRPVV